MPKTCLMQPKLGKLTPSRFKTGKMYYSDDKSWRCFIAPKDDPRVLYAGGNFADRGHCCQSYGDIGSDCAVDSVTNPDSGCVIFERNMVNDRENPCWEMLGCSWLYETERGGYKNLVFDNVEIHDSYQNKTESAKYNQAFDGLLNSLKNENYRSITLGVSPDLCRKVKNASNMNTLPWGYSGYSDAAEQQYLLYFDPKAKPEKLPEQLIMGFDYDTHFSGVQKVAKATNKSDYSPLENVDEDTKGMVLINRNKQILGYVLWNEDENGENEVCNLAVVPQSRKGEISGSVMLMSEFMRQIKNVKGNWSACVDKDVGLRLLKAMASNVSGGEKAGIPQDYSGRGLIDLNIINSQGKDMYNVEFKIRDIANNGDKQNAARDIEQNDILKAISQNNHDR